MALPIIAGTRSNPLHVGGHWRITNVGWGGGGGVYVAIEAYTEYTQSTPGTRTVSASISRAGKAAGGKIIAEENIHASAVDDDSATDDNPAHPAFSRYLAILSFTSMPASATNNVVGFTLTFAGAQKFTDPVQPVPTTEPFCGATTVVTTWSNIIAIPIEGNPNPNAFLDQTMTIVTTTPAGTGTVELHLGPLQDVSAEQVGTGARTISATSQEIWYQDIFGNYVNTHRPCSELAPPGSDPQPATKTEGWNFIGLSTYPRSHYQTKPSSDWGNFTSQFGLVTPKDNSAFGDFMFDCQVMKIVIGPNSDHLPIFDDLPNGDYDFRLGNLTFTQFSAQTPTQKKPASNVISRWSLPSVFPMTLSGVRYDFRIGTSKPAPYSVHTTLPAYDSQTNLIGAPFAAGTAPPSNQSFTP